MRVRAAPNFDKIVRGYSGRSEAWYRARFGTVRSTVQICPPRPIFRFFPKDGGNKKWLIPKDGGNSEIEVDVSVVLNRIRLSLATGNSRFFPKDGGNSEIEVDVSVVLNR